MLTLDGKCFVPIGESGLPPSIAVRCHSKSLNLWGVSSVDLHHDIHTTDVVPAVCIITDIPEDSKDSFHDGRVHATAKDKIFQTPTAMRDTVETVKIIMENRSHDDVVSAYAIWLEYTEGGSDPKPHSGLLRLDML